MDYIKKQLVVGEHVLDTFRRHWWWLTRRLLVSVVATVITVVIVAYADLQGWSAFLPILPLLYGVLVAVGWWKRLLVVTSQRLLLLGGVVNPLASKDDLALSLVGNVDDEPAGMLGGFLGERNFNFQSGDPKSGIIADGFPEEALRAVRQAQGSVSPASMSTSGQPGEGRIDSLGRQY